MPHRGATPSGMRAEVTDMIYLITRSARVHLFSRPGLSAHAYSIVISVAALNGTLYKILNEYKSDTPMILLGDTLEKLQ